MRKPYTPTTEEIRTAYVLMRSTGRAKVLGDMLAEFDRWLNTERARIRAEVAEEVQEWADRRGVNVGDGDGPWWDGYRQAQREALMDAQDLARHVAREHGTP